MRTVISILLFSLLIVSGTVVAATQAPVTANYHYSGTLKIDADSGDIQANWHIDVHDETESTITFLLRDTLYDIEVAGNGVKKSETGSKAGMENFTAVTVTLDNTVANRTIQLSYGGVLIPEPMENLINTIEPDRVELNVDSFWFPIDARFNKVLTADLKVLIGEGWQGVTTGEAEVIDGGVHIFNRDPRMDIAFTLSRSFHITQAEGFTIYDQREQRGGIPQLVKAATQCREFLNSRFGQEQPLPVGQLLITSRPSSGYARENYIVLTDISNTKPAALTRFVCHEFAHFWARGGKFDTVDNWINESFAEYLGTMAVREYLGPEPYTDMITKMEKQIAARDLPPIWEPGDTARGPYLVNYRKGPLVLARLEQQLGQDTFLAFTQALFTSRKKSTPMLLDILEQVAGKKSRDDMQAMLAE